MITSLKKRTRFLATTAEMPMPVTDDNLDTLTSMAAWMSNRIAYHTELLNKRDKPIHYDNLLYHRHCIELLQDMKDLFFHSGDSDNTSEDK